MDASKFLNMGRRYLWLFIVAAVVAGLVTFFVLSGQPHQYEAKTRLLVGPSVDSPSPDLNSLKIGSQLMQTYADMVTTRPFLESISTKLDQKINLEKLAGMMDIKQNPDTRILTIIVKSGDPKLAVGIANAAAQSLVEISPSQDNTTALLRSQMSNQSHQIEQIISSTEASIQDLEAKLVALGNVSQENPETAQATLDQQTLIMKQLTEERARLSDALRTLATIYQVLLDTNTNQLQIIEPADTVFPVNQNLPLRVAAAALAGLLLAVLAVFAYEFLDDTIRVPGDVARSVKVPLLSTIEKYDRVENSGLNQFVTYADPQSEAANCYRTAVAKLLFSIGQSMPSTFMLSSVGQQSGDDTAVITANLGVAFAQAGYRVTLVDAQLYNPMLTKLLASNGKAGLYDLLTTKSSELKLISVQENPEIQFLPAGLATENWSGAMLNSANIIKRLEELQKDADIVLIAGPSASGFAESMTLASQVNGVILVARYGETSGKLINEVADNLSALNIKVTGILFEKNSKPMATKRIFKRSSSADTSPSGVNNTQAELPAPTAAPVKESNIS